MTDLVISIDFTGVKASNGGIGILQSGLHSGVIDSFSHFTDDGRDRLYAYMVTDGVRHRDSFNLGNPKALWAVKDFLLSAGVAEDKIDSSVDVPFGKLVGRTVYFQYTAPQKEGGYPKYSFLPERRYNILQAASSERIEIVVKTSEEANGATTPAAPASGEFDFLLEN